MSDRPGEIRERLRDAAATLRASAVELEAVRRRGGSNGSDGEDLAALGVEAERRRRLADDLERTR